MSVPNREISVLKINKILAKSEKLELFVGGPKIPIFENWLIFYTRVMKMRNLVKFDQNLLKILQPFTYFVFL